MSAREFQRATSRMPWRGEPSCKATDLGVRVDEDVVTRRGEGHPAVDARTDEEWMRVYQAGSQEAFDELYARYAKPIYNFLRRTAQPPDAADDLFQKTFLKLHTGRHQYRPQAPFRRWIFTIARNVLRDDARHQGRQPIAKSAYSTSRLVWSAPRVRGVSAPTSVSSCPKRLARCR